MKQEQQEPVLRLRTPDEDLFWKAVYLCALAGMRTPSPQWFADNAVRELRAREEGE